MDDRRDRRRAIQTILDGREERQASQAALLARWMDIGWPLTAEAHHRVVFTADAARARGGVAVVTVSGGVDYLG